MSKNDQNDFDDLEAMFGQASSELEKNEKIILSQNIEGFASCFPDWDLHPPVVKSSTTTRDTI